MKIFDLTRTVGGDTMAYPGTEKAQFTVMNTIPRDGFQETLIRMYSHTGTHMDAPAHMLEGAPCLDRLPPGTFVGRARIMDCTRFGEGDEIPASALPDMEGLDFLMLSTGWEEKWGSDAYFGRFPVLSPEAAEAVAAAGLKGVGVDMMSVDPMGSTDFPVHMRFFRAGLVINENLCGLAPLRGINVELIAMPFKYENADGAPARVVAKIGG